MNRAQLVLNEQLLRGLRELAKVKHLTDNLCSHLPRAEAVPFCCAMLVDCLTSLSSSFNSVQGLRLWEDLMEEQKGAGCCPDGLKQPELLFKLLHPFFLQGSHVGILPLTKGLPNPVSLHPLIASHCIEKACGHLALVLFSCLVVDTDSENCFST